VTRVASIAVGLVVAGCASSDPAESCGVTVRVERASDSTAVLDVCARRAVTEAERIEGLGSTSSLPPSRGLLLEFPVEGEACIQNGPVAFAIDEVFASDAGAIVAVELGVDAGDSTPRCHTGVRRVLEVNAGVASTVSVGDGLRLGNE
jgi:uncharacterized membrane protein (UPF0127 family)